MFRKSQSKKPLVVASEGWRFDNGYGCLLECKNDQRQLGGEVSITKGGDEYDGKKSLCVTVGAEEKSSIKTTFDSLLS